MPARRILVLAALGATLVAAVLGVACGGGGGKTATPAATSTASDAGPSTSYFDRLSVSVQNAESALAGAPAVTSGDATPDAEATFTSGLLALEQLADQLSLMQPPPAAAAAHQELLDATRALIDEGKRAATQTPVNEATAEAEAVPVVDRFTKACDDLSNIASDSDSPIDLSCASGGATPTPAGTATP